MLIGSVKLPRLLRGRGEPDISLNFKKIFMVSFIENWRKQSVFSKNAQPHGLPCVQEGLGVYPQQAVRWQLLSIGTLLAITIESTWETIQKAAGAALIDDRGFPSSCRTRRTCAAVCPGVGHRLGAVPSGSHGTMLPFCTGSRVSKSRTK